MLKRGVGRNRSIHGSAKEGVGLDGQSIEGAEAVNKSIDILNRVPSQKLSVLIKRKNTMAKKEKRRLDKEARLQKEK